MAEIFARRSDWLVRIGELTAPLDVMTICPLDGLTGRMVVQAMGKQGMLKAGAWKIVDHGTKIFIQRQAPS